MMWRTHSMKETRKKKSEKWGIGGKIRCSGNDKKNDNFDKFVAKMCEKATKKPLFSWNCHFFIVFGTAHSCFLFFFFIFHICLHTHTSTTITRAILQICVHTHTSTYNNKNICLPVLPLFCPDFLNISDLCGHTHIDNNNKIYIADLCTHTHIKR